MVSFESYFINLLILLKSAALIFKATVMQKYFHEFDFSKMLIIFMQRVIKSFVGVALVE